MIYGPVSGATRIAVNTTLPASHRPTRVEYGIHEPGIANALEPGVRIRLVTKEETLGLKYPLDLIQSAMDIEVV